MVESEFGLTKFINAVNNNLPAEVVSALQLNVNIETATAVFNIDKILSNKQAEALYGVTVGRVDLVSSMGADRNHVNSEEVYNMAHDVLEKTKRLGAKACIGGAVSIDSLDFLKKLHSEKLLDKFETRYAIFDPSVTLKNLSRALFKAQMFEYEWLVNKMEYYQSLANQDEQRVKMIQSRINKTASEF